MKMKKRIVSMVTTLCMLLSLLPNVALATGTTVKSANELAAALGSGNCSVSGNTVQLKNYVCIDDTISITGGTIVLDLNNCTIGTGQGAPGATPPSPLIAISGDANVSITGNGYISGGVGGTGAPGGNGGNGGDALSVSGGTLTILGGNVSGGSGGDGGPGLPGGPGFPGGNGGAALSVSGGTLDIRGGSVTGGNGGLGGPGSIGGTSGKAGGRIVNASGDNLKLYTLTLSGVSSATAVSSLTLDPSYRYGMSGAQTDSSGKLCVYLPDTIAYKTATVKTVAGATYSGAITDSAGTLKLQLPTATEYAAEAPAGESGTDYVLDTNAKTLTIKTAKGAAFWSASGASYLDYTVSLAKDIDVSGFQWSPVGYRYTGSNYFFTGTFDGQGHTITGLTVNVAPSTSISAAGLFGMSSGTIQNVGLIDCNVSTDSGSTWGAAAGGIVGQMQGGAVTNCYSSGMVSASASSGNTMGGGVTGSMAGSIITNCYSTATVSASGNGTNSAGGIVGSKSSGTVANCYYSTTASITGTNSNLGTALADDKMKAATGDDAMLTLLNGWVNTTAKADYYTWKADSTPNTNHGYPVLDKAWASMPHSHCVCSGTNNIGDHTDHTTQLTYTAIPSAFAGGYLEGNIYLDRDVTLTTSLNVASGKTLNLCLNGYKLTANDGSFSVIKNNGTLSISDCNKSRQNSISSYAWDEVGKAWKTPETIAIQGGVITGGNAPSGGSEAGGGGICNLGTLCMYSGTIAGNRAATYGGGVHNLGSMSLYGGTIQNNGARSVDRVFNLGTGGGIYTKKLTTSVPSLLLYGGTITKNLAGNNGAGVFAGEGAIVSLAGNTEIYENINPSYSANFYVDRNTKLKVMGTLQNTHPIGVNLWTPGVFTENGSRFGGKVSDQISKFTSDTNDYRVVAEGNQLSFLELYAITPSVSSNGTYTVKVGGREVTSVAVGETVTIAPTANSGYAVDTVTVKQTESPNAAVTVSNNTFTMPDYAVTVTVTFKATGGGSSGGSGGGGGGGTTTTPTAPVIIGGKTENIGTSETTTSETKVTVDSDKLNEKVNASQTGGSVQVPVSDSKTAATAGIVVKNVESMAKKNMTLEVKSGAISYQLPTTAIDTSAVMTELGATDTSKVPLNVTIKKLDDSTVKVEDGKLIVPPVSFTITATYGGKTAEVKDFSQYVQRSIEISKEQAAQITTAVVKNEDGTLRHVPTYVYQKDGKWFATINSRTNSTYALIRNEATFADAQGKWYESVVSEMASRKIINGKSQTSFDGDASITRAEFAAIVIRALGLSADGKCSFTDVKASDWYYGAIGTAAKYSLVNGYINGSFAPNAEITRQEAMAMVQRAAKVAEYTGTNTSLSLFKDSNAVSAWAKSAAEFNVGSGLIVGSNGALRPGDKISRAETATVILRLLQKAELVDVRSKI